MALIAFVLMFGSGLVRLTQAIAPDAGAPLIGQLAGLFELAGIFGTLACGWVSDKVFGGNRTKTGITFMTGVGAFLLAYWLAPLGTPYWLLMFFLFMIGACIYGPVLLIGLQAIDMSARHVAGTAAGFTGLFGYVIGATMASSGIGFVAQPYGWNVTYPLLAVFVLFAIALFAANGPTEKRRLEAARERRLELQEERERAAQRRRRLTRHPQQRASQPRPVAVMVPEPTTRVPW